jgi:hypothetical protein
MKSWLFRALNRADIEFPRFEGAIRFASTIAAIGLYTATMATAAFLECVAAPAAKTAARVIDELVDV